MNTNETIQTLQVLKGEVNANPIYSSQKVKEYNGNPFIEALPEIFNFETIMDELSYYPNIDDEEKSMPIEIRYHCIKKIKRFVQPMAIHLEIERRLSTMIRYGYLSRNPCSHRYYQNLRTLNELKKEKSSKIGEAFSPINEPLCTTASCFSIIGISGVGKTTAIERLLLLYPQVIVHTQYNNKPMVRTQIVWLKIDCPYDGSIKTLCKMFFKAIDDILGDTDYFHIYGHDRNSSSTMMINMAYLSSLYSVGVLVIDELQHLVNPKNNPKETLNFLVTLVNTIGVPLILVGNPLAQQILTKDFRQARRASAEGDIVWDRMKNDEEWDYFIESLWKYQWLYKPTPLDKDLNNALYEASQGITAITVIVFMLVQEQAINTDNETITTQLIKSVSENSLKLLKKMLNALKNGSVDEINKYGDITIDINEIEYDIKKSLDDEKRLHDFRVRQKQLFETRKGNIKTQLVDDLMTMDIFTKIEESKIIRLINQILSEYDKSTDYLFLKKEVVRLAIGESVNRDISKIGKAQKISSKVRPANDLRTFFEQTNGDTSAVHLKLLEQGYIRSPFEELYPGVI